MKMEIDEICRKLASKIAKKEDGKTQAKIGDIRQILKIVARASADQPQLLDFIYTWGCVQADLEKSLLVRKTKKSAKKK